MIPGQPLVSLIITSYNRAEMIPKAIKSALKQTYPNLEIIISDNCSTDGTHEIITSFAADSRIRYSRNEVNIGMLPNFRKAAYELASGEFITFLSSDDVLADPNFITSAIMLVNKDPEISLVFSRSQLTGHNGEVFSTTALHPYFEKEIWEGRDVFFNAINNNTLSWGGTILRKTEFERVQSLKAGYINSDIDTNYKIMIDSKVGFINNVCYHALLHKGNASEQSFARDKLSFMTCINDVADYALGRLAQETVMIEKWRNYFLTVIVHNGLKSLVRSNFREFRIFRETVALNYPFVYKNVAKRKKLMLYVRLHIIKQLFTGNLSK